MPPDRLYRGIIVPSSAADASLYTSDLVPGSDPQFDEQGRKIVADGNEYGVYMTDNPTAAESVHGSPKHGDVLPDSPRFSYRGDHQRRVTVPQV